MANPQSDKYIKLSTELWQELCKIRISGEARQVFDVIVRQTYGYHKKEDRIATSQFTQMTALSSFAVYRARKKLANMNLITVYKKEDSQILSYSIQKDYDKWRVSTKKTTVYKKDTDCLQKRYKLSTKKITNCLQKCGTQKIIDNTKDTLQKIKQPPSAILTEKIKRIHADGCNISALLNKLKKQLGWTQDKKFPESVLIGVCDQYFISKPNITNTWSWLTHVMKVETHKYFAGKHDQEGQEHKKQPVAQSLKEIMKGIG